MSYIFPDFFLHSHLPSEYFLVSKPITINNHEHIAAGVVNTHPWRGPAKANNAAEYDRYGSESVDPTRSVTTR